MSASTLSKTHIIVPVDKLLKLKILGNNTTDNVICKRVVTVTIIP